jgi:hypothetical protein
MPENSERMARRRLNLVTNRHEETNGHAHNGSCCGGNGEEADSEAVELVSVGTNGHSHEWISHNGHR